METRYLHSWNDNVCIKCGISRETYLKKKFPVVLYILKRCKNNTFKGTFVRPNCIK